MPHTSAPPLSRAQQLITQLQLKPHPEGGWFREVFRSQAQVQPADARPPRAALTSIYFLLEAGQHSRWHKVLSDEVWVHLEGLPLDLWSWDASSGHKWRVQLGRVTAMSDSQTTPLEPQYVIGAGLWQAAQPQPGADQGFTLVACTVGPGFDFNDFEMMQADSHEARQIASTDAHLVQFI